LAGKKIVVYYGEPIPSSTDHAIGEMIRRYMGTGAGKREQFLLAMCGGQRSLFGIYAHRAATMSVRQGSPELLLRGLVGATIANYIIPERRRIEVGLAVYYHCAGKLGLNRRELFADAARYATEEYAERLVTFAGQDDVTLAKYGWRELKTPEGVKYSFSWA
jgi:hypothetical protein